MVINQNENAVFVFKEGIEIMLSKINMISTDNERFRNESFKRHDDEDEMFDPHQRVRIVNLLVNCEFS
jgi:hypothetical protein